MKTFIATIVTVLCTLPLFSPSALANPTDPIGRMIHNVSKPYVAALEKARIADSKLDHKLKQFEAKGKGILSDKASSQEQKDKAMKALALKATPLMNAWFTAAQLDEKKYQQEVSKLMAIYMAKSGTQYSLTYKGFLSWFWRQKNKDVLSVPQEKEITLAPPFEFDERRIRGDGNVRTDQEEGDYDVSASRFGVGGHENVAGLGHFFRMEESYETVEVTAALPETSWYVSAFADIFGASGSSGRSQIQILSDGNVECERNHEHAGALAPVLWYVSEFGTDNVVINCQFPAPALGDEIVLRFNSVAGAWAGGLAQSSANVRSSPRDLRIRLQR